MMCFLSEGGLFRNGFHVPCIEGFSVCQNFLSFFTSSPDPFLRLVTVSCTFSGVILLALISLVLPLTKDEIKIYKKIIPNSLVHATYFTTEITY